MRLATGTLYTALDRLTADGHVQLAGEEMVAGRIRRYYGLTEGGAAALRAEAQRMAEAARIVTSPETGVPQLRAGLDTRFQEKFQVRVAVHGPCRGIAWAL